MTAHIHGYADGSAMIYTTLRNIAAAAVFFFLVERLAFYLIRPPLAKVLASLLKKPLVDVDKVLRDFCYGGQFTSMAHVLMQLPVVAVVLTDPALAQDTFYAQSDTARYIATVTTGYFVYDLVICITRYSSQGFAFLVHAICSLLVFAYGTLTNTVLYYAGAFLVWEASTPFVIIRHLLFKLKADDTKAYKVNGLMMMLSFFLSRNVWGVYASYVFFQASEAELRNPRPGGFHPTMIHLFRIANLALNGLNVMWFWKMFSKALQVFGGVGGQVTKVNGGRQSNGVYKTERKKE